MAKIIGNTTATPNPKPDWNQTDENKADYIKNKPTILSEEDIAQLIAENGGSGSSIDPAILQRKLELWQPNTEYKVGDVVVEQLAMGPQNVSNILVCIQNHTSGDDMFDTVTAVDYWDFNPIIALNSSFATCDNNGNYIIDTYATKEELGSKQDMLVSGENIKTINGQSLLGDGNIDIETDSATIIDQTYNPESENAQSGKAVAEAIANIDVGGGANGSSVEDLKLELYGTKKEIVIERIFTESGHKEIKLDNTIPIGAVITKKTASVFFYFVKENGQLLSGDLVNPPYTVTEPLRGISANAQTTIDITYEVGENVDGEFDRTRRIMKVNKNDDDITIFQKMLLAYRRGYYDVIFETSTYELSDVYDYIRNETDMAKGLPVGNYCRYFFNGSTIISNAPVSDNYSDSRNILDCQSKANTYEVHDCILINNGGRYCVHDEGAGDLLPYSHLYRNVKMIYNNTELTPSNGCKAFGSGVGHTTNIVFENCQFIHNGQDTTPIAIHNVPTRKGKVTFNLTMTNCYINQYQIDLANFDKSQDELNFYMFGNLWAMDFTDTTPKTIKVNCHVANKNHFFG